MDNSLCSCSILNPTDSSAPPKTFTFDGVYHINSTTEQIYNEIAYPLVEVSNGNEWCEWGGGRVEGAREGEETDLVASDIGYCHSQ